MFNFQEDSKPLINQHFNVIGVMSGTSLDGLDLVAVEFVKKESWGFSIKKAKTYSYSPSWKTTLSNLADQSSAEIKTIEKQYVKLLASHILDFMKTLEVVDAVCAHGHTVFHEPEKGITLQIGNTQELADLLKVPLVCDFRTQDVALGGQGAPLVPIGDQKLFSDYTACLNLGGFANVSKTIGNKIHAYDIGAVNTVLNYLAQQEGMEYDAGGELAKRGTLIPALAADLDAIPFYQKSPPKSLGIEWMKSQILPLLQRYKQKSIPDLLHTYTYHIGKQIACCFMDEDQVLITGGGSKNEYLISVITQSSTAKFSIPEEVIVDFKEALIFGFLGVLRLENEVNCLASVTGCKYDHCSGNIFYPNI